MGVGAWFSKDAFDQGPLQEIPSKRMAKGSRTGNPDQRNFRILRFEVIERFTVVLAQYPNCTNFEGKKVLVFENVPRDTIHKLDTMDPHFCDSEVHPSPVARFVPTGKGWQYAIEFCKHASKSAK